MNRLLLFLVTILFIGCKKEEANLIVSGTVMQQGGCWTDGWLIQIDKPDHRKHAFICEAFFSAPPLVGDCSNAIYIHLPAYLAQTGKKIKFSRWNELASCLSSSFAPKHLEVYDLSGD